jgi:tRNA dimethylallyltransferase
VKINKPRIIIIGGPTASGKSDLAITLARRFHGEIISADSRQVYRGMDIGTGKVTKKEQKMVPHHLLDITDPRRQYTVARWKTAAQRAIRDIVQRGKTPVVCGGTGFYIDTLVYDMALPAVKPNTPLRVELGKLGTDTLFKRLTKLDPARAATIDQHNPVRLIRALEIVMSTGQPVPAAVHQSPYELLYLGVNVPKEKLTGRIAKRLDARLKRGMVAEVKKLHANGVSWKKLESFGLEYRWLARYLQDTITRTEMRDGLLRDIIAYSKRQMTWFRRNSDIQWISTPAQASRLATSFLK